MNRIPIPHISEFLYEDFMRPMNLTAHDVSIGADISLDIVQSILNDTQEITPDISQKLGAFFGISATLFYDIQKDLYVRNSFPELRYA